MRPAVGLAALLLAPLLAGCAQEPRPEDPWTGAPLVATFDRAAADTVPTRWVVAGGVWRIARAEGAPSPPQALEGRGNGTGALALLAAPTGTYLDLLTDTALRAANASVGLPRAGLAFHVADVDVYDVLSLDLASGRAELLRVANGTAATVARGEPVAGWRLEGWHNLSLDLRGAVLRAQVDGRPALEATSTHEVYPVGLWVEGAAPVVFDDYRIDFPR